MTQFRKGDRVVRVTNANGFMPVGTKLTISDICGEFMTFKGFGKAHFYRQDKYKLLVTCRVGQHPAIDSIEKYWEKIGANR